MEEPKFEEGMETLTDSIKDSKIVRVLGYFDSEQKSKKKLRLPKAKLKAYKGLRAGKCFTQEGKPQGEPDRVSKETSSGKCILRKTRMDSRQILL